MTGSDGRGHLRFSDFRSAADLFDAARDAAIDAERRSRVIRRMESREGVRAQSYESHGRSGHRADAMAATDARIDYERRTRLARQSDYDLIDLACSVLYGSDQTGAGGVSAMMGPAWADCMWWRFCAAAPWAEVAAGCGMSEAWCRKVCVPAVLDMVDAYGCERIADGLGMACD